MSPDFDRPLTLTLAMLGGQGGGVVSSWLVSVAERENFHVQATSVPGVAQRTGATIYYLEFHPRQEGRPAPVMGLMPTPGLSDIVVASELLEAARMVERGIVNRQQTTLIASTHRAYVIGEKAVAGDGRTSSQQLLDLARVNAKRLVSLDMERIAQDQGAVISAAVLGAIAGAGVLPFANDAYQEAIRQAGIAVEGNLACFEAALLAAKDAGAEAVLHSPPAAAAVPPASLPESLRTAVEEFPAPLQPGLRHCVERLVDYQDAGYATEFLAYIRGLLPFDDAGHGYRLSEAAAKGLALWMSFEDTIRVADLKTRRARRERLHVEAALQPGQVLRVTEFLKPRVEEICGTLPRSIGAALMGSAAGRKFIGKFTGSKKIVSTNIGGYLLLRGIAGLRFMRRRTLRYHQEHGAIREWFDLVKECAAANYGLACEVALSQELASGYGDTFARGQGNLGRVMALARSAMAEPSAAEQVRAMREEVLNGAPEATSAQPATAAMPDAGAMR